MISDNDLDSAVAAGIISADAAAALRSHASGLRATPLADEENFRLISSFNDIFVTLAGILFLFGVGWLGGTASGSIGSLMVAVTAWGLSEFFTLKRRMALPSIVFFLFFAFSILTFVAGILNLDSSVGSFDFGPNSGISIGSTLPYLILMGASYLHWRRFEVPIAIAAIAGSLVMLIVTTLVSLVPEVDQWILYLTLLLGIGVFAFAMYWDRQDRERKTRKSDVAFWLHLLASPLIVHSVFVLMGINWVQAIGVDGGGDSGFSEGSASMLAALAVGLYLILGLIAVIVDRRAMLVSALAYVITAIVFLITRIGATSANMALAIMIIGSALLILSAFWQNLRRWLFQYVPEGWKQHLPPAQI